MKKTILLASAFLMLAACGKKQTHEAVDGEEVAALRAAYRAGASMDSLLGQRITGLYNKQKAAGKTFDRLVPQSRCVYDGDVTRLQGCFDQALTRFMALKPIENNVQKLGLTTGGASSKASFTYQATVTNIIADGNPASVSSVFQVGQAIPGSFYGNAVGLSASGPRFLFAALGTLLGSTDGESLAGGGIGAAFGYLDINSLTVYYGAAGCAGGVVVTDGSPTGDGACGVIPVAAVPLIP